MINRILIVIVLCTVCCIQDNDAIPLNDLKEVDIQYVFLKITTPYHVSCDDFADAFDDYQTKRLTKLEWTPLLEEINALIKRTEFISEAADTRMIISLSYVSSEKDQVICLGNNVISFQNRNYEVDSRLRKFIISNFK
jgi:hypothetical protein